MWLLGLIQQIFNKRRESLFSITAVLIKRKQTDLSLLMPQSFDFDKHLAEYPVEEFGFNGNKFKPNKALYILYLLSSIPADNNDIIEADGAVPINARILQKSFDDYKLYINYLIVTNVITTNNQYIAGDSSRRYRWNNKFDSDQWGFLTFNSGNIKAPVRVDEDREKIAYYLRYWYHTNRLTIDTDAAIDLAYKTKEERFASGKESWEVNRDTGKKKYPLEQYKAVMTSILRLKNRQYSLNLDDNIHRLHSVLTNLNKKYRNFLRYNGQTLASIDVKNCQPYLISALLNPEFWSEDKTIPLTLYSLAPNTIERLTTNKGAPIMIRDFVSTPEYMEEFIRYKELVSAGLFYEHIMAIYESIKGEELSRKDAKTTMLAIIFAPNKKIPLGISRDVFNVITKEVFPNIYKLLELIKTDFKNGETKPHARLSCLLQNIESHIILNVICKRIWEERRHSVPVFTIHDSIVTTPDNVQYIQEVMIDEFSRLIGTPPTTSIEIW